MVAKTLNIYKKKKLTLRLEPLQKELYTNNVKKVTKFTARFLNFLFEDKIYCLSK